MKSKKGVQYTSAREDKPAAPGYSPEYISADFELYKGITDQDTLMCYPPNSCDTVLAGLRQLKENMPDHPLLGSHRPKEKYEWLTASQVNEKSE